LIERLALRLRQRRALAGWALAALAAGALAAPVAGALLHETLVARFADETLADARLRQALADSEVARLRLLPEALANDRDVTDVAQPANGPASGTPSPDRIARLNARLERMAREAGPPSSI
jgi:two-component system C4-dicarboxylate transport sensor histidine kinase DctB